MGKCKRNSEFLLILMVKLQSDRSIFDSADEIKIEPCAIIEIKARSNYTINSKLGHGTS